MENREFLYKIISHVDLTEQTKDEIIEGLPEGTKINFDVLIKNEKLIEIITPLNNGTHYYIPYDLPLTEESYKYKAERSFYANIYQKLIVEIPEYHRTYRRLLRKPTFVDAEPYQREKLLHTEYIKISRKREKELAKSIVIRTHRFLSRDEISDDLIATMSRSLKETHPSYNIALRKKMLWIEDDGRLVEGFDLGWEMTEETRTYHIESTRFGHVLNWVIVPIEEEEPVEEITWRDINKATDAFKDPEQEWVEALVNLRAEIINKKEEEEKNMTQARYQKIDKALDNPEATFRVRHVVSEDLFGKKGWCTRKGFTNLEIFKYYPDMVEDIPEIYIEYDQIGGRLISKSARSRLNIGKVGHPVDKYTARQLYNIVGSYLFNEIIEPVKEKNKKEEEKIMKKETTTVTTKQKQEIERNKLALAYLAKCARRREMSSENEKVVENLIKKYVGNCYAPVENPEWTQSDTELLGEFMSYYASNRKIKSIDRKAGIIPQHLIIRVAKRILRFIRTAPALVLIIGGAAVLLVSAMASLWSGVIVGSIAIALGLILKPKKDKEAKQLKKADKIAKKAEKKNAKYEAQKAKADKAAAKLRAKLEKLK